MPELIPQPSRIEAAGNKPKQILEYFGKMNSGDTALSIAHMKSPPGWVEPAQTPEFDEYTLVLSGEVLVEHEGERIAVSAGSAIHTRPGERVCYSTPQGAEYIAVCLPAFSPETVHRDGD